MLEQPPQAPEGAPPYVVTCFELDAAAPSGHDHVAAVETADPDGGSTRWRSIDVIAAIRDGERFVVEGLGSEGVVEPAVCPACPQATVTVSPLGERPRIC